MRTQEAFIDDLLDFTREEERSSLYAFIGRQMDKKKIDDLEAELDKIKERASILFPNANLDQHIDVGWQPDFSNYRMPDKGDYSGIITGGFNVSGIISACPSSSKIFPWDDFPKLTVKYYHGSNTP